jgi:hypothetical protein
MRPEIRNFFEMVRHRAGAVRSKCNGFAPHTPFEVVGGEIRPTVLLHRAKPGYHLYAVGPEYPGSDTREYLWGIKLGSYDRCQQGREVGAEVANDPEILDNLRRIHGANFLVLNDSLGNEAERWPLLAEAKPIPAPLVRAGWWRRLLRRVWR